MGFSEKMVFLEHVLTRGQFIIQLFGCPGEIDQDRKVGCAIQKVQGPIPAAGTASHKGNGRGRATYGSPASRGSGTVTGISLFCEYLNIFVLFIFVLFFFGKRCGCV